MEMKLDLQPWVKSIKVRSVNVTELGQSKVRLNETISSMTE